MNLLLAEDDALLADALQQQLAKASFQVEWAENGAVAEYLLRKQDFDIAILDLGLPMVDGLTVLKRVREAGRTLPILVLTALDALEHRVAGLQAGADDYLTKPFDKRELMARIQAIVRRSKGHSQSVIKTGPITVNLDQRTVEVDQKQLDLTAKEYGIIELLSLRKGSTLTKEMFLNHLYGGMDEPEVKIIDVFICKLRKKIDKISPEGGGCIETVWGRGYVLRDPNGGVTSNSKESANA
jgi:two-component system cell cycle response regulator CtrA